MTKSGIERKCSRLFWRKSLWFCSFTA